ncbi:MAG: acetate kinase [Myxococcota bacterium]
MQVFAHRLRKYIGAYAAVMGGVDAIVFTGGIGQNSALMRERALQRMDFLGVQLDIDRNRDAKVSADSPVAFISADHARTKVLAIATDEERAIAEDTAKEAADAFGVADADTRIPIAISGRHIHLTRKAVAALFGEGHELTPYRDLSQPGQFACEERLTLVGPRGRIERVRVLGPPRGRNQIEISRTDEFALGVDAPVRNSGKTKGSAPITLEGPAGTLHLEEGLICARRHIHMTPDDAERFGVADKDIVDVAVDSQGRDLVFGDVLIRVSKNYRLEMHIDTDEANAAEVVRGHDAVLAPTSSSIRLVRKRR